LRLKRLTHCLFIASLSAEYFCYVDILLEAKGGFEMRRLVRQKTNSQIGITTFVLYLIILLITVLPANPSAQNYECYPGLLLLFDTSTTGFDMLKASTTDVDSSFIRTWLGMILTAQALEKNIVVTYDDVTGRILSIYGPK
jgi:drug/metabolite transporter superfamily protein YnfA